jgi:hypothetical protein
MKTRPASPWLFGGPDGEAPPNHSHLGRMFKLAAKRAGVRPIKLHGTRHSLASQLVIAKVPIPVVQKFLGHADIATTMRYTHVRDDALDEVYGVLGADGHLGHAGLPEASVAPIARKVQAAPTDAADFEPFLPLLGKLPDAQLAAQAGVSKQYVGRMRAKRGIPVFASNTEATIAAK